MEAYDVNRKTADFVASLYLKKPQAISVPQAQFVLNLLV